MWMPLRLWFRCLIAPRERRKDPKRKAFYDQLYGKIDRLP